MVAASVRRSVAQGDWQSSISSLLEYVILASAVAAVTTRRTSIGYADRGEVFDRVRLTIAPLNYGAGVKGKIIERLAITRIHQYRGWLTTTSRALSFRYSGLGMAILLAAAAAYAVDQHWDAGRFTDGTCALRLHAQRILRWRELETTLAICPASTWTWSISTPWRPPPSQNLQYESRARALF